MFLPHKGDPRRDLLRAAEETRSLGLCMIALGALIGTCILGNLSPFRMSSGVYLLSMIVSCGAFGVFYTYAARNDARRPRMRADGDARGQRRAGDVDDRLPRLQRLARENPWDRSACAAEHPVVGGDGRRRDLLRPRRPRDPTARAGRAQVRDPGRPAARLTKTPSPGT